MLIERVDVDVRDGEEPAFEAAFCEVRQRVFMSAGFRGLTVAQGADRPSRYLVQVRWETAGELRSHTRTRFDRCWAPVQPFLARPLTVEHLAEREGLSFQGPGVLTDLDWLAG